MKKKNTYLFDCDGTLVDSEVIAMGVAIDILADAVEDVKPQTKIDRPAMVQEFAGWHFDKMIAVVGDRYGVKMDDDALQAKKIPGTIEALKKVEVIPGIPAFLDSLQAQGIEKAVVTTSEFSRVNPCLETTGISHHFPTDKKFSGADSLKPAVYKPEPDIYLHAMKQLGAKAEDCVAFEDSTSGVKSARAAGIDVVGIVSATHIPASGKEASARKLLALGAAVVVTHADDLAAAVTFIENPSVPASFKHTTYLPHDTVTPPVPSLPMKSTTP